MVGAVHEDLQQRVELLHVAKGAAADRLDHGLECGVQRPQAVPVRLAPLPRASLPSVARGACGTRGRSGNTDRTAWRRASTSSVRAPKMNMLSSPISSRISMLAPSSVPKIRPPFRTNFMLLCACGKTCVWARISFFLRSSAATKGGQGELPDLVPDASVPAVEMCCEMSLAGVMISASETL